VGCIDEGEEIAAETLTPEEFQVQRTWYHWFRICRVRSASFSSVMVPHARSWILICSLMPLGGPAFVLCTQPVTKHFVKMLPGTSGHRRGPQEGRKRPLRQRQRRGCFGAPVPAVLTASPPGLSLLTMIIRDTRTGHRC
jgi:hypothetical protein